MRQNFESRRAGRAAAAPAAGVALPPR
jgi:hypothetical protein